jgi:outer membrane protein insertion porin family
MPDIKIYIKNNGYLFSNVNAVEVKTANDTIDFEIRITEGPIAYFKSTREMTKQMTE